MAKAANTIKITLGGILGSLFLFSCSPATEWSTIRYEKTPSTNKCISEFKLGGGADIKCY